VVEDGVAEAVMVYPDDWVIVKLVAALAPV
jgi:hypothetical protein